MRGNHLLNRMPISAVRRTSIRAQGAPQRDARHVPMALPIHRVCSAVVCSSLKTGQSLIRLTLPKSAIRGSRQNSRGQALAGFGAPRCANAVCSLLRWPQVQFRCARHAFPEYSQRLFDTIGRLSSIGKRCSPCSSQWRAAATPIDSPDELDQSNGTGLLITDRPS